MFLDRLQQQIKIWRDNGYLGIKPETENILRYIQQIGFLHAPQLEAFETYIYLKEINNNQPLRHIFKSLYQNEKELLLDGLNIPKDKAIDYMGDVALLNALIKDKFPNTDYSSQVYALTMGAGKTLLMGVMIVYDFILAYRYPQDKRFAKNALIFAPDKTIIESLKEVKDFDYLRIFPKEYSEVFLNIKYHYLEDIKTSLTPIGNYNVIVSNSQKIILKTKRKNDGQLSLFDPINDLEKREIENKRLRAIRGLQDLAVFVDEAHHAFGKTLEGELKKVKQTIDYLHHEGETNLMAMINFTGTPYVEGKMLDDVVYYFGLKEGIEQGILKQVNILDYGNVKTRAFIDDVLNVFFTKYGQIRLDDKLPKIAFYSASIEDLQQELRPMLEKSLLSMGKDISMILEYHTEAEENKTDFLKLDTSTSNKQIILLVGKGTEGWNCKSLVATALFRKPKSSVFVLQSTTRCLRAIGDNSTKASIFLSDENYKILDKELENSFRTSVSDLNNQNQKKAEYTLNIIKRKMLKVKRKVHEIISVRKQDINCIKINLADFISTGKSFFQESAIYFDGTKANYQKGVKRDIKFQDDFTFYEIIEKINRYTHLDCLSINMIFQNGGIERETLVSRVNTDSNLLAFIVDEILRNVFAYTEKTTIYEEEIELTKAYPFKISLDSSRNKLVIWKKDNQGRLGFHIDPYNFDSEDEKELFNFLRQALENDESLTDIYFTGGVTNQLHNDFFFEYYNPEHKKIRKYFPDFLIETSKGRYLVVEVKDASSKLTYEENKKCYNGKIESLFDDVLSKEIGFKKFQELNQQFEYRIIFNAKFREQQEELIKKIVNTNAVD